VKQGPRRAGDPPVLIASSHKVKAKLGWQPRYRDLRSIVQTSWKWHAAHPNGYRD